MTYSPLFEIIHIETIKKENKLYSLEQIKNASRSELVAYLESWGTACYDDESTSLLRECAIDNFKTEGC